MYTFNFHSYQVKSFSGITVRQTEVEVFNSLKEKIAEGMATQSIEDQDERILGQKFALTDALEVTKLSKKEKRVIWNTFFHHSKAAEKKFANYLE